MADASDRNLDLAVGFKAIERILDPCDRHRLALWRLSRPHEHLIAFDFEDAILASGNRVNRTVLE
jgi:hypothetical protein